MSYVERICTGRFRVGRRNKKRRILGRWSVSPGWGQEYLVLPGEREKEPELITGYFAINRSNRLKIFLDDGDGFFEKKEDDLLTSYKLNRNERKSFYGSDNGSFVVEYINWHVPPELCTESECYGDYYRIFMNPENSDVFVSPVIDSQKGELLRGLCIV